MQMELFLYEMTKFWRNRQKNIINKMHVEMYRQLGSKKRTHQKSLSSSKLSMREAPAPKR